MKQFDAWWFPDDEYDIIANMVSTDRRVDGRLTYQYKKYEVALGYCRQRALAIDVGAHIGLWSYWMARDFSDVHAFEPYDDARDCWQRNMPTTLPTHLHACALGAAVGMVGLTRVGGSTGNMSIDAGRHIHMQRLDDFSFLQVDLLKIDCEGYEAFVVEGGCRTIERCRPVVIVEQKPGIGQRYNRGETEAVDLLRRMGAVPHHNLGGDYILSFP